MTTTVSAKPQYTFTVVDGDGGIDRSFVGRERAYDLAYRARSGASTAAARASGWLAGSYSIQIDGITIEDDIFYLYPATLKALLTKIDHDGVAETLAALRKHQDAADPSDLNAERATLDFLGLYGVHG